MQFVRIFGYTILLCLGWTKTNINQNSKIGSVEQNNESIFLGYQNEISGCTEQLRKSQVCCWKIAILLSYVQDVVNSTTTTFPYCPYNPYWELSVQWHSPCESRRVSLLLWFEVCEGKRIETGWKNGRKMSGFTTEIFRENTTHSPPIPHLWKFVLWCYLATPPFGGVVLWPSLVKIFPKKTGCWRRIVLKEDLVAEDKPKLGATWPRLLLEVWSCGRVVGNGTEETVIPNGVLTVQMVGFFSCSLLLGEFSSSLSSPLATPSLEAWSCVFPWCWLVRFKFDGGWYRKIEDWLQKKESFQRRRRPRSLLSTGDFVRLVLMSLWSGWDFGELLFRAQNSLGEKSISLRIAQPRRNQAAKLT